MKRFYCRCGQEVFFENSHCNNCGSQLGFDPESLTLFSQQPGTEHWQSLTDSTQTLKSCEHRNHPIGCNWLLPAEDSATQCISCRLTRTIPAQHINRNIQRWKIMESDKRRMLYGLLQLNLLLPLDASANDPLIFDFLEDQRSNPNVAEKHIYSGHSHGVITMNVAEADGSYREAAKEDMNEHYRTLLGHFRHEIGHYFWAELIQNTVHYKDFKQLFGDDTRDYPAALEIYYANGPITNWQDNFISAYASSHPLEDWAETWAHYMHMSETLETAQAFNLINGDAAQDFDTWLQEWMRLVVVLNALNRSTGNSDAYPFVISAPVQKKLKFIHHTIHA